MPIHNQHSPGGASGQGNFFAGGRSGFGPNQAVEDWVFVDGKPEFVSGERLIRDRVTGRIKRIRIIGNVLFDDFNMPYSAHERMKDSWSGLIVTVHTAMWCFSPFGFHYPLLCRDMGDGWLTEPDERAVTGGNYFLCAVCHIRNDELKKGLWGWELGYQPKFY